MTIATTTFDTPKNPALRREWIRFRLRAVGHTWKSVAALAGVSPQAVQNTASGRPSLPLERLIATLIGVPEKVLFAEHYARSGDRIPVERSTFGTRENILSSLVGNAETRGAA